MSTISSGNTTTTAFVVTGDTTGNLVFTTGGANTTALTLSNTQAATFASNVTTVGLIVGTTALGAGDSTRFKNRIINGDMRIAQRANSVTVAFGNTVPTTSTGYPCVDRWFVYSAGANVTAAQVAGSGNTQNNLQITGAASVTAVGVGQRIEANNSYDLAGQTVTLSVNMSNSLLTNVTWTASYANTSNTFGTIGTPTKVQISTGAFTVNSTITNYSTQISLPSNATTGVEILFTVGAQTSGTWVIGKAQLEVGSSASAFEYVDYTTQLAMCYRYVRKTTGAVNTEPTLYAYGNNSQVIGQSWVYPVQMRTSPTTTTSGTLSVANASGPIIVADMNSYFLYVNPSSGTAGYISYQPNGSYQILFSAEL